MRLPKLGGGAERKTVVETWKAGVQPSIVCQKGVSCGQACMQSCQCPATCPNCSNGTCRS